MTTRAGRGHRSRPPTRGKDGSAGRQARRGDDGFAGGLEGLVFGLLFFVAGTLLVVNIWGYVDTKMAVDTAARQAARSYVEAATVGDATIAAREAADEALSGYGRNPPLARIGLGGGAWGRCQRVTVSVAYTAPIFRIPFVGPVGAADTIRADHSELIDPYRSGLPGVAQR